MNLFRHDHKLTIATVLLSASCCGWAGTAVRGQGTSGSLGYRSARFSPAAKELLSNQQKFHESRDLKRKVMAGDEPFAANEELLKTWYVGLNFPMMTRTRGGNGAPADAVENLERMRVLLLKDIGQARDKQFRGWLIQQVIKIMPTVAKGNYHPIVRYNAMLTVANLNQSEAGVTSAAKRRPPVPLPAAFAILQDALTSDQQIDAVRVAALTGILRHVELDPFSSRPLADDVKHSLADDLLSIVQASDPPAMRDPGVHYWMRLRATEILGRLQSPDQEGKIADALGEIVNDEQLKRRLRCAAGEAIGRTGRLPSSYVSEPTALAVAISKLANAASQEAVEHIGEISLVAEQQTRLEPGLMSRNKDTDVMMPPRGLGDPDEETSPRRRTEIRKLDWEKELELARRTLLTTLAAVNRGLQGADKKGGVLAVAQNEPHTTNIARLGDAIGALVETCDTKYEEVDELLADLREVSGQLESEIDQLERATEEADEAVPDEADPENGQAVVASGDQPVADGEGAAEEQPIDFQ